MPEVVSLIRKTFNTPVDANPWTWDYVQDGVLRTVQNNIATALAAYNAVKSRYGGESFAVDTKRVDLDLQASSQVHISVVRQDDGTCSYRYFVDRHMTVQVGGFSGANILIAFDAALTAAINRFIAETFAGTVIKCRVTFSTEEAP